MKNIFKYRALLFLCLISMVGFAVTSCDDDDDLDTSQMGTSGITLKSYGPTPALRGSEIRFIGDNVDKVTAITIPGSGDVTAFTKKEKTEIRIILPQDAEEGYPVLKTPQGNITGITLLTYEEPISISSITTAKVRAGDLFTIEGDYLYLIAEVIFTENAVVLQEDFVSQSRAKIELLVPADARSGKMIVSNGAEIPIEVYSDQEATIGEAVVTAVSPLTIKAGETLTITGTDLDLFGSIVFGGAKEVDDFTVSEDNTQIKVVVPADAQDGKLTFIAKSGLEYVSAQEVTLVVPTELTASPASGLRAGDMISITGKDLDLVTSVLFPGMDEALAPASISATKLTVAMPEAAQSGDLLLNLTSGKTVSQEIITQKPAVTTYNPSPVTAGGMLTVQGTDLDLVFSVSFGEDAISEVESATSTELTVKVPVAGISGNPIFIMTNGEEVEMPELEVVSPVFCFVPELPAEEEEIFSGTILILNVENGDKLTEVVVNDISTQFILHGSELHIMVPPSCNGATTFTLISSNGEVSYTINIIYAGKVETVIMDDEVDIGGWANSFRLYKADFQAAGFKAGSILRFYTTPYGDWPMIQINDANWSEVTMPAGGAVMEITDVEFTQEMLDQMMNTSDGWSDTGLVVQGDGAVIHKVSVIVEN